MDDNGFAVDGPGAGRIKLMKPFLKEKVKKLWSDLQM